MKSQKGCAWCVYILLGVRRVSLGLYASPKPVKYLGEPSLVLWRHWQKFVKIAIFPQKHPYDRIFWWSKMGLGVHSTPQFFLGGNEDHRHHVAWILKSLDQKNRLFWPKNRRMQNFLHLEMCLMGAHHTQKLFSPLEVRQSISKNFFGFLTQF